MDRIVGTDTIDLGDGKQGFRGKNPDTGQRGTVVTFKWLNDLQEEACKVIEAAGIELDGNKRNQLDEAIRKLITDAATPFASVEETLAGILTGKAVHPQGLAQSVQSGGFIYAIAGGTANELTCNLVPTLTEYKTGLMVNITPILINTGSATLNIDGLGAVPITRLGGANLLPGDLLPGSVVTLAYDGTLFQLLSVPSSIPQILRFGSTTTWTVPFTMRAKVTVIGGGGGAGGSNETMKAGGGGGGGGAAISILTLTKGQVIPITIGAGGARGGTQGRTGGTTSFGSLLSATGGNGGVASASSPRGGSAGSGVGGNIFNLAGEAGQDGNLSSVAIPTGDGGSNALGWPGGTSATGGQHNGVNFGSGGGGSYNASSGAGGNGAGGLVIVEH